MNIQSKDQIFLPEEETSVRLTTEMKYTGGKHYTQMMHFKGINKRIELLLRIAISGAILFFLLRSISWSDVQLLLHHVDYSVLMIGLVVGVLGVFISAYQWKSLLEAERIHLDLRRLVNFYFIGIAFNHFLPTSMGGDVVKAYYVGREGKNNPGSASAVMMSRITGFWGMMLLSLFMLLFAHAMFPEHVSLVYICSCAAACFLLAGAFGSTVFLPRFLPISWQQSKIVKNTLQIGIALRKSVTNPRAMLAATSFGVLYHFSYALNYYAYASIFHLHVPLQFYLVSIPIVSLISFLPISVNGYGLREGAFVYLFSLVHIPISTSILLVFLMDIEVLFFGLIGGLLYFSGGVGKEHNETIQVSEPY